MVRRRKHKWRLSLLLVIGAIALFGFFNLITSRNSVFSRSQIKQTNTTMTAKKQITQIEQIQTQLDHVYRYTKKQQQHLAHTKTLQQQYQTLLTKINIQRQVNEATIKRLRKKTTAKTTTKSKRRPSLPADQWQKPSETKPYPDLNQYPAINIDVNLTKQRVYIKNEQTTLYTMYASSGKNNATPTGDFQIQNRGQSFYNAKEKVGANYWTSFKDWGVYLFHSVPTDVDGHYLPAEAQHLGLRPSSHGCIRLSIPDARWLYENIQKGTPVSIHH